MFTDRLEWVKHYDGTSTLRMQISYIWNLDNTVDTRTEYDASGQTPTQAVLTFWYDNRQRLTRERRAVTVSSSSFRTNSTATLETAKAQRAQRAPRSPKRGNFGRLGGGARA